MTSHFDDVNSSGFFYSTWGFQSPKRTGFRLLAYRQTLNAGNKGAEVYEKAPKTRGHYHRKSMLLFDSPVVAASHYIRHFNPESGYLL